MTVKVHPNGDSDTTRTVNLDPRTLGSVGDLRMELGKAVMGCGGAACRVFTATGREVDSLQGLHDDMHLFLVHPGRNFVWPAFHVGYKVRICSPLWAVGGRGIRVSSKHGLVMGLGAQAPGK
jgi:hypothetical protein